MRRMRNVRAAAVGRADPRLIERYRSGLVTLRGKRSGERESRETGQRRARRAEQRDPGEPRGVGGFGVDNASVARGGVTVRPRAPFRVGAERRVPLARHLPPDHRREPREAPRDARAPPRAPAVALDGVHDAQRFLNREPRARAVVVQNVERVRLRGVVEHDDRVDVAPLAFVRYARDAEPTPEPGVHGRARERARLSRRGQGGIGVVSPAPATVYAVRRVPAPAPAVAPAAASAAAAAAPRSRHPPSRHEASTFGEARLTASEARASGFGISNIPGTRVKGKYSSGPRGAFRDVMLTRARRLLT